MFDDVLAVAFFAIALVFVFVVLAVAVAQSCLLLASCLFI